MHVINRHDSHSKGRTSEQPRVWEDRKMLNEVSRPRTKHLEKSAIMIARFFVGKEKNFTGENFSPVNFPVIRTMGWAGE